MQGLNVLATIVDELPRVDVKFVKVKGAKNIGQGHQVTRSRSMLSEDVKEKHYARFDGSSNYSRSDRKS